jgi:hypothetical protein
MKFKYFLTAFATIAIFASLTQNTFSQSNLGSFSGDLSVEAQTYRADSMIGARSTPEQMLSNSSLNLYYRLNQFEIGVRYEAFLNPIMGIDPRYKGTGIAYRNVTYRGEKIEASAGNFYDQFGSGLIFRSYYDSQLGIDNSVEGFRVVLKPVVGLEVKGIIGEMRNFWNYSNSIIRAGNIDLTSKELYPTLLPDKWNLVVGASFVSKYQADENTNLILPLNELAYSGRFSLFANSISVNGEFAMINNHPEIINDYTYNKGNAVILNVSYLGDGIGTTLSIHRLDNMDFRAETDARGNSLMLNYIPSLTKQELFSKYNLYPYGSQLNGEVGVQWDFNYHLAEHSFLGGELGGEFALNFSRVNSIKKNYIDKYTYNSPFFELGDTLFYDDINAEFTKYITDNFDLTIRYANITNNKDILFYSGAPHFGMVYANLLGVESTYRFNDDYSLHGKIEHTWQTQDSTHMVENNENGNWLSGLAELSIKSSLMVSFLFDWNYGNQFDDRKLFYYNANVAYLFEATRISLSYGRTAGGILCIGGVCRAVPATNGFYLSLTSSF